MSIDSAKAYVERMKSDEEFRKKVLECKDGKKRMELVKVEGFDFTEADIKVVSAVLDDKELEKIVGGHNGACWTLKENICPLDSNTHVPYF